MDAIEIIMLKAGLILDLGSHHELIEKESALSPDRKAKHNIEE